MKCTYLSKIKRFVKEKYGAEASASIMKEAWKIYVEIIEENGAQSKLVRMHTHERIYPGIAMFKAMTVYGISRAESAQFLIEYYRWRSSKMAKFVKAFVSLPGIYKKVPGIFTALTKRLFNEESGFEAKYYDTDKKEMRIDMLVCPYYEICKRYDCAEIVPGYCEADDVCYGNMHPKLKWGRSKTIAKGGEVCDFKINIEE